MSPVHRPDPATERADALYDAVSEALRERGRHVGERIAAQRTADAAFTALDEHLRSGGLLPTPWRSAAPTAHPHGL
ncbi:hypothetical protein [Nocardiopsis suaedae]|uniref:Uncharacterized protein n=1 Tax=Nocardiopsis suaedae TaxID=3018444 RepID=A0ABT4TQB8_9ACTN|nr:hypothetical protein [Nocardiopsis suaedae]MDA2806556.1 hypothetical protein [Nocardiopsis suaedae]